MTTPEAKPPDIQQGKVIKALVLNEMKRLIPSMFTGGPGIRVEKHGDRFSILFSPGSIPVNGVGKSFRVKSVEIDYLICRTWDGRVEGSVDVKVALPPLLQRTPFDGTSAGRDGFTYVYASGNNIERTSTKTEDDTTEEQEIIPRYVVNDTILAIKTIAGSSGVFQGTDGDGNPINPIEWMDLNIDDRMWRIKA